MIQILTVIAPLFLIIFASALLQKWKNIGNDWQKVLNEFALNIGLPALIFSALAKTSFSLQTEAPLIITTSIYILLSFAAAVTIGKIFHFSKPIFLTVFLCFVFDNFAYLGIPVLTRLFSASILPTASIIVAIYLFWIFTVGTGYLEFAQNRSRQKMFANIIKNLITNPLLIAVMLGLIVGNFRIVVPSVILQSIDMLSASVTPTVLIVIGLFIGTSTIGKLSEWTGVFLFSLATLVILPACFYFGVTFFGFNPSHFSSSIIEAAMPLGTTPFALADRFGLDKKFIARSIVLSTIFSVLSLPFWIWILSL